MPELIDRCCCQCGDHFDGEEEDDYCSPCYDKIEGINQMTDWKQKHNDLEQSVRLALYQMKQHKEDCSVLAKGGVDFCIMKITECTSITNEEIDT